MLFDRICPNNGIRHLLTAPYSPTTTGKVERFHRTMRSEFLVEHDRCTPPSKNSRRALDEWVAEYNTQRPHQSLGDRPPDGTLRPGRRASSTRSRDATSPRRGPTRSASTRSQPLGRSAGLDHPRRLALSGGSDLRRRESSRWSCAGLVEILHAGVLVATHAERRQADKGSELQRTHGPDAPGRPPQA